MGLEQTLEYRVEQRLLHRELPHPEHPNCQQWSVNCQVSPPSHAPPSVRAVTGSTIRTRSTVHADL